MIIYSCIVIITKFIILINTFLIEFILVLNILIIKRYTVKLFKILGKSKILIKKQGNIFLLYLKLFDEKYRILKYNII